MEEEESVEWRERGQEGESGRGEGGEWGGGRRAESGVAAGGRSGVAASASWLSNRHRLISMPKYGRWDFQNRRWCRCTAGAVRSVAHATRIACHCAKAVQVNVDPS